MKEPQHKIESILWFDVNEAPQQAKVLYHVRSQNSE